LNRSSRDLLSQTYEISPEAIQSFVAHEAYHSGASQTPWSFLSVFSHVLLDGFLAVSAIMEFDIQIVSLRTKKELPR
jgi:hypothetical protein